MPSQFIDHYTRPLSLSRAPSPSPSSPPRAPPAAVENAAKETLRSLLVALSPPVSRSIIGDTINSLVELEHNSASSITAVDAEEELLKRAVTGKLVVGLYAEALDTYLSQASEVESESEWWADIERSRQNVAWYLLQTLPSRLLNLTHTILRELRTKNLPLRPSLFTPTSLRSLFPSTGTLRPNTLTTALFPHLAHQTHILSFPSTPSAFLLFSSSSIHINNNSLTSAINRATSSISQYAQVVWALFMMPFELTRQECRFKRKELEKIRDKRAEALGTLAQMRGALGSALDERPQVEVEGQAPPANVVKLKNFVENLENIIGRSPPSTQHILLILHHLSSCALPSHISSHTAHLRRQDLYRPSRFTLLWPRLVLLPPLTLYIARTLYASRASLTEVMMEGCETVEGFVRGWLMEPLRGVVRTVRTGGEDGVIVRKEGVAADFDSLERMTLSLAKDELHYAPEQLEALSRQIRLGDLTPVLQLFEENIRRPLKSVVAGTLLRTVFIQVQKAKVDIDQALTGIDKLLKSQELTFAFVGVAPAFSIVYLVGGYLRSVWTGGRGRGRYGGKHKRAGVWFAIRRIERLLTSQPKSSQRSANTSLSEIPPLTAGLLLLSVTHLRTYAERYLPMRSRLREGFLEDVEDLADPVLGRHEKMRVVERMWRSWGSVLGWGSLAEEGTGRW